MEREAALVLDDTRGAPGREATDPRSSRLTRPTVMALGGVLVLAGALATWATVGPRDPGQDLLPSAVGGVDLLEGRIAMALGIGILATAALIGFARSDRGRRGLAVAVLAASVGSLAIAAYGGLAGEARLESAGLDETAGRIAETTGLPVDALRGLLGEQLGDAVEVDRGSGLLLVLGGGLLAAAAAAALGASRTRTAPGEGSTSG
jgi:hypothetical protein